MARLFPIVIKTAVAAFFLALLATFVYNSGFGYDALEILVIAQSLTDGQRFYDLIPAKPVGLYSLVSAWERSGFTLTHASITAFITVWIVLPIALVVMYCRRFVGNAESIVAGIIVGLAAVFMELNFLVAEGLVVAAGLIAAICLAPVVDEKSSWRPAVAGLVLGAAFNVKQPAAFYIIGSGIWLLAYLRPLSRGVRVTACFLGSAFVPIAGVAGYFAMTGRWEGHLHWTYVFPLTEFPASTEYAGRLITKLAWFTALVAVTATVAVAAPASAMRVFRDRHVAHMLMAGTCALYPFIKSQAPHYLFPCAAFWAVAVAAFWVRLLEQRYGHSSIRWSMAIVPAIVIIALLGGSVLLYRPDAFGRLSGFRDYHEETRLQARLMTMLPGPADRIMFLSEDTMLKYYLVRRRPNIPVINFDVQAQHYFRENPQALIRALDDPELRVVEFCPEKPPVFRLDQLPQRLRVLFWEEFACALRTRFQRIDHPGMGRNIWVRTTPRLLGSDHSS